jgi:hypothetical protein
MSHNLGYRTMQLTASFAMRLRLGWKVHCVNVPVRVGPDESTRVITTRPPASDRPGLMTCIGRKATSLPR